MKTPVRCAALLTFILLLFAKAAPPAQPQNVQQAWLGSEAILLWDAVPGATNYNIYRADESNTWTAVGSSVVPRFRDPAWQLLPSFYLVTAVNADGESVYSDLSTVSYADPYLVTHSQPQVWDGTLTPTNAIIQWYTADPNGSQGIVDWGLDSTNFNFFAINTNYLGSQRFDLTNLTPLTIYYYRLTSINSNRSGVVYLGSFGTPDTNHPPVAEDYTSFWPSFTNGIWIPLRGHDSNFPPAMTLTFRIVSQPTNGTLSEIQSGWMWGEASVIYTPAQGSRGYDYFRYVVNNGTWDSAPALVTITNWNNTPPATTNGWVTTPEDTPVALTLPNFDANGDPITFTISPLSAWKGTVTGDPPNLIFIPETNYNGFASFSYTVTDGYEGTWGWFQIDVTPVNDKPVLTTNGMQPIVTWEDWPVQFWLGIYDVDWTGNYEIIQVTPPAHGTLETNVWQLLYMPETNFYGVDSFTLAVREADGTTSDPLTYYVTVNSINDEPAGIDQSVTTPEDTDLVITPAGVDIDGDPALFTYRIHWQSWPQHGWVQETGSNFIYHPYTNFTGIDSFQFDVVDDLGFLSWSHPGTVYIQVLPVGEAPIAEVSWATAHQNEAVTSFFRVSDVDSETIVCEIVDQPTNGTVTISGTNFTYLPIPGVEGSDIFTYRAFDGVFYSAVTNVYVWVTGPNHAPNANAQAVTTPQNTPLTFFLDMWDQDNDVLNAILVTAPSHGTVTFNNYWATYTPAQDFYGADSFTYQPFDGTTNGNAAVVTIAIVPPNRPPIANNASASGAEDSTIAVTLSGSDPDGDSLTYQIVSGTANGVLSGSGANRSYRPNTNFNGSDSFTFRVSDGQYNSASATVSISVTPVNDPPVATNTSILDYEDLPVTFVLGGTDVDNGITTCTFTIITPPAHGTLSAGNRVRTYTPATNYFGPDSFTFQIFDGTENSGIATVSITVNPLNDAPVATPQSLTTAEDTPIIVWPLGTDVDGAILSFDIASYPAHGYLVNLTSSNITYAPSGNYNGPDSFSIRVSDGALASAPATISVNVTPVNDAPFIGEIHGGAGEDIPNTIRLVAYDLENDPVTFTIVTQPTHGTLTGSNDLWIYLPFTNYTGPESFTYKASDGMAESLPAEVNLIVFNSNDAPEATPQSVNVPEDSTANIVLTAVDVDSATLTYSVVTQPAHGTLSGTTPNLTYTPNANFNGADSFVFSVSDGLTNSSATVSISVTAITDLPAPENLRRRFYIPQGAWPPPDFNVHLWWHAVAGADSYNIYRADGTNAPLTLLVSGITTTNYVDTTSESGHYYTYSVTAVNAFDEGTPATVTTLLSGGCLVDANEDNWGMWATRAHVIFCNSCVIGSEGQFDWGLTTNYTFSVDNTNMLGCHHVLVSNLQPETVYYYRIISTDSNGVALVYENSFVTAPAPFGNPQEISVNEDNSVDITLTGQDPAPLGFLSTLTYSIASGVSHGTLVAVNADTYRYTPATDYNGTDSFTFKVNNGELDGAPATVSITVDPMNDLPVAVNISRTTAEDTATTIPALFTDVDGGPATTAEIVSQAAHGTADVSGTNLIYFPATNYVGTDSFTYRISDGYGAGNTATVSFTITNVEDSPIAFAQSVTASEDVNRTVTLAGIDPDGDAITFSIFSSPSHGTLTGTAPNVTYRAATNYNGSDSFTFRTYDGKSYSAPATVSITVTPVNDPPIASNIVVTVAEDTAMMIPPAFFDADGEFVAIEPPVQLVSLPAHGTAWSDGFNMFYQPATNYTGADSFTYHVTDGQAYGNTATVSITVSPVNDAPIVTNRTFAATEDTALNFTLTGFDVDGDALTFSITSTPLHGAVTGDGPSFTYTPVANYAGTDSFYYTANDGTGDGNTAAVIITIAPSNDAPSATNQNVTTTEDTAVTFAPLAGDIDGDSLTFTILTAATNGVATVSAGNLVYTPAANYNGADSFQYRAQDSNGGTVTARVFVTVQPVNDAPVANNSSRIFTEDTITAVTLGASDVDGDALTFSIVTPPLHGTLSGTGAGRTYTPAANYNGPDSFTFRATDPSGASSDAVVSITLLPANDRPVGVDQTVGLMEETPLWFIPTATDVDGDSIGFVIIPPMKGTAVATNGGILYTPQTNYFGNDILYYYPTDAISTGALTVIVFNITNVNDAPTANDRTATTAEDTAVNIALSGGDLDNDALTFTIISGPTNGTLSGTGASRTYTPAANYNGSDSFTYLANDGTTNSGVATVSITVTPVNDAPSLLGLGTVIDEDAPYTFTLIASDVDNDPLTYTITSNPSHGTLTGTGPTFTYTPSTNYTGPDQIIIRASDGTALSAQAYVSLTMRSVNDAPVANPQTVSVNEDSSVIITFTGFDVDGDTLTYTRLSNPAHGTVTGTPLNISSTNANFTYTPAANYYGPDSFTFKVHDGRTNSSVATVTIDVIAVNEAPVANAQSVTVTYNTAKAITLTGSDFEGSALTYSIETAPTNGTLSGTAPNITYTPTVGSAGADQFTFRVSDGESNSAPATVSITTLNPAAISTAPTSLSITVPTAPGTLILNWSCTATNEDGFKIERSLNSGSGWSQIATTGINIQTFTNTGLTSGTRYYYRMRSYNRLGNSAYSNTKDAKPR